MFKMKAYLEHMSIYDFQFSGEVNFIIYVQCVRRGDTSDLVINQSCQRNYFYSVLNQVLEWTQYYSMTIPLTLSMVNTTVV